MGGFKVYELCSRILLCIYPLVLLISWSTLKDMRVEYDEMLHAFLDVKSDSMDELDKALEHFFEVSEHVHGETAWLMRHKITAYVVCYVQFMQLILYFGLHPKMAVLTNTVWKAMDQMVHFLMLFGVLFIMLAFMAHWMLGEKLEEFGTFGDAVSSQGRMLFGEFIYAWRAGDLHGKRMVVYWIYASTFMLLVFFTLLNFLLAIIVDSFVDVKSENQELVCVNSFVMDSWLVWPNLLRSYKQKWPTKNELIEYFEMRKEEAQPKKYAIETLDEAQEEETKEAKVGVSKNDLLKYFNGADGRTC